MAYEIQIEITRQSCYHARRRPALWLFTENLRPERRESRIHAKASKATLLNVEEAPWLMAAYREDRECAFAVLSELTFVIDDLFSTCVDLIELHPGVDDLGGGLRVKPEHTSFAERMAYGKMYLVDEELPKENFDTVYPPEMQRHVDELISAQALAQSSQRSTLRSRSKRPSRAAR